MSRNSRISPIGEGGHVPSMKKQQSAGVKKLQSHWNSNPKTAKTNQRKGIQVDDRPIQVVLNPHESQWKYMNAPPLTTLTIFEETVEEAISLVSIYDQVVAITKKNPWLTGRLRMMPDGISLFYGTDFVDCFQSYTRKQRIDLNCKYEKLIEISEPYAVKKARDCVDQDHPLFQVTCLVSGEVKKQIVIVFSISNVLSDAYTFYQLYAMLDSKNNTKTLRVERQLQYLDALKSNVGSSNFSYTDESVALQYNSRTFLSRFLWKRQKTIVHYVDEDVWLKKTKNSNQVGEVEVSTNDCLTSWFFKMCDCNFGIMKVNFRNKILDIDNSFAGNYTSSVLYRSDDYQTPYLIRLSLGDNDKIRRAARLQIGKTETIIGTNLPSYMETRRNNSALSSNWHSVSKYITFEGAKQVLHIPIIKLREQPYKHMMLVFQATPSRIGAIIIGRGLVMDEHDFPLSQGILKKSSMKFDDIYKPTAKISSLQT